ncbi:MAG: stage V sporulation protein AD [Oscillospiraceae bacterium]|nr:stage V sporulation protein AD [Oscillospiraceae bacterium]
MTTKKIGGRTLAFASPPSVLAAACVGGKKEGAGPLGNMFDTINDDAYFGEQTWEKAESAMQKLALDAALSKGSLSPSNIDALFAGDLLNQCTGSSFAHRAGGIPYWGLFGACSTMAETLSLGAAYIDGGYASTVACVTSSHYCTAERQFRMPLEYGGQRTPTAQWTVTGSGAVILGDTGPGPYITHITPGKIVDAGISDANNMGAAMAPAAYDTLAAHFGDLNITPDWYDLIVTGDLGAVGAQILTDFFSRDGIDFRGRYNDCGLMIYERPEQDPHAGGSGCGCSASVLAGRILPGIASGVWKRVLFAATGAMLSAVSSQQGESIPSICYAVALSNVK